jgi:hypothetical protein
MGELRDAGVEGLPARNSYRANLPNPFHRRDEVGSQKDNRDHETDNQSFHTLSSFLPAGLLLACNAPNRNRLELNWLGPLRAGSFTSWTLLSTNLVNPQTAEQSSLPFDTTFLWPGGPN